MVADPCHAPSPCALLRHTCLAFLLPPPAPLSPESLTPKDAGAQAGAPVGGGSGLDLHLQVSSWSFRNLAIGIGIQNFPEGLAVSLPLRGAGFSTWRAFW